MVPNDFMTRFADLDDPAFGQSILGMAMHQAVVLDEGLQVQKVDHFQLEEQSYAEMVREVIVSGDVETLRGLLSERMVNAEFVKTATGQVLRRVPSHQWSAVLLRPRVHGQDGCGRVAQHGATEENI